MKLAKTNTNSASDYFIFVASELVQAIMKKESVCAKFEENLLKDVLARI